MTHTQTAERAIRWHQTHEHPAGCPMGCQSLSDLLDAYDRSVAMDAYPEHAFVKVDGFPGVWVIAQPTDVDLFLHLAPADVEADKYMAQTYTGSLIVQSRVCTIVTRESLDSARSYRRRTGLTVPGDIVWPTVDPDAVPFTGDL